MLNFINAFSASTETIMWLLPYLMSLWYITLILHLLNQPCDAGVNLTWSWCMILFYVLLDLADILLSGFELIAAFVYLAGPGLSCGPQDLYCSRRTQQLWPRALALQLRACVTWGWWCWPGLGHAGFGHGGTWLNCSGECGVLVPPLGLETKSPGYKLDS